MLVKTADGATMRILDGKVLSWGDAVEVGPHTKPVAGEGNLLGVVHGASSEKVLSAKATDVAEALIGAYPWLLEIDVVAIQQYCRAEARARLLDAYAWSIVENKGVDGVLPYIWAEISKAETNAFRRADSLGLSPEGRMKIAKDAGFASHFNGMEADRLKKLVEEGRKMRGTA